MRARSTLTTLLVLVMIAAAATVIQASGPTVTIEDLGPAGLSTNGRGVNASGLAAGYGQDGSGLMFGFTQGATFVEVPPPAVDAALQALAVNDSGVVVGSYMLPGAFALAYRYDSVSNVLTWVPLLTGANSNTATAINAGGVVAGFTVAGKYHGFRQSGADPAEDIADLGGGQSVATGINVQNVVVGYALDASHHEQAIRYDTGLHVLTSLGGANSVANGINDAGVIVGFSQDGSGRYLATRWSDDTHPQSLGVLNGDATSQAQAINSKGDIVGYSMALNWVMRAFLWQNGTLTDLNDLLPAGSGWQLMAAYAINDTGVIVGDGFFNGTPRAFRLTMTSQDDADTTPPVISFVHASPDTLWPPNNQMVPVSLTVDASDNSGVAPTCSLVGLTSTDPRPGDMVRTGPLSAALRASKSNGSVRGYTLTVQCTDAAGNVATASATVTVPKSNK